MLWTIRAEIEVQYESEKEPDLFDAVAALKDEIGENGLDDRVEITKTLALPADWEDCCPWGGDGLRTCGEIFAGKNG